MALVDTVRKVRFWAQKKMNRLPGVQIFPQAAEKPHKEKLLFLAWFNPEGLGTIRQTIEQLIALSSYRIDLLNLYTCLPLSPELDLNYYDGIIIHNTISYDVDNLRRLDSERQDKLKEYAGVKIVMKQDEHFRTGLMGEYLGETGIDLLLTICDDENARRFYPEEVAPKLQFMQFLTGYIPESFRHLPYRATDARPIDVGYRGSIQPAEFGRLAWEKRSIGEDFRPYAEQRGLVTDISSRWEDRFMGDDWLAFLGRCKATLGVESGSDIVDKDGDVERDFKAFSSKYPDASDEEILRFLAPYEEGLQYRAISPRHFEAAACRSVQVLFEGEYQGIFLPGQHYIPLKRDFSNVDEVMDTLLDERKRVEMTDRAFEEIVLNPKYAYSYFVKMFDERLEELFSR